jgi:hypothetical protein
MGCAVRKGGQWHRVAPLALGSVADGMWDGGRSHSRRAESDRDCGYRRRTVPGVRRSEPAQPRSFSSPSRHREISRLPLPPSGLPRPLQGLVSPVLPRQPHRGVETVRGGPPGPAARVSDGRGATPRARCAGHTIARVRPTGVVRPYSDWGTKKMRRASDDRRRPVGHHRYVADAMPPRPILPSCRWQNLRGPHGLWSERHRSLHLRCLSRCSARFVTVRAAVSRAQQPVGPVPWGEAMGPMARDDGTRSCVASLDGFRSTAT